MTGIHVGDAIRKLREERGWNRADLARIADIRPNTIGDLERLGTPTMKTIGAVANAFGLRVEDIFYKLRELRHSELGKPVIYADPAHVRYHDLLERILQDHEPRCINTVIAVLETIAGGSAPETSGNEKSQGRSNPGQAETAGRGNPGHRELMAVAEKINPYDTSGADRKRNDIPEPSIGVPNGRSRSKSGWRG